MEKVIFDTDYIVRFLIKESRDNSQEIEKIFDEIENKKAMGYVSVAVVLEVIWIFEKFYQLKKEEYLNPLITLFSLDNILFLELPKKEFMRMSAEFKEKELDFTDIYLLNKSKQSGMKLLSNDRGVLREVLKDAA